MLSFDRNDLCVGCLVHVFNRGNNRQTLFKSDDDYQWFLKKATALGKTRDFEVIAYCLMPNHFHYFLRLRSENPISKYFQRLQLAYAKYSNRKYARTGHVFEGPFKSAPLNDFHHVSLLAKYIHMNPVTAGLVVSPRDWPYSNYLALVSGKNVSGLEFYKELFNDIKEYANFVENSELGLLTEIESKLFGLKPI